MSLFRPSTLFRKGMKRPQLAVPVGGSKLGQVPIELPHDRRDDELHRRRRRRPVLPFAALKVGVEIRPGRGQRGKTHFFLRRLLARPPSEKRTKRTMPFSASSPAF